MSDWLPWLVLAAGVLLALVCLGWLCDWTLRRRLREALQQRGRDEQDGLQRLAALGGSQQRKGYDPPGWLAGLEASGDCEGCGDD